MIICVTDKKGIIHIVDFNSPGRYRTICGKILSAFERINIFAADAAIKNGCNRCHSTYDVMYVDDLNILPSSARSSLPEDLNQVYEWIKCGLLSTEYIYHDYAARENRRMEKLRRRCQVRKNIYVPTNKYR